MNYIGKYNKIVSNLIKKDFQNLARERIIIKEKNVKYKAHVRYFPWGATLYLSKQLRKFPEKVVKRIIFHELCHLELFKKEGIIKNNFNYLFYIFSSKTRKRIETEANILMIKKGHGREVMAALKDNLRRGLSYPLSIKEIKQYMDRYYK
ncbi:MAG: hypothetical protein PHD81_00055 [Candidatus Nanoarchaeia archaeon]|nr:hypothetical protein [Candidatus Nanoarchaeia archaeon]MDD5587485.1 hypothetical protein [Candidatus Nanoarchaeia archaeon]